MAEKSSSALMNVVLLIGIKENRSRNMSLNALTAVELLSVKVTRIKNIAVEDATANR